MTSAGRQPSRASSRLWPFKQRDDIVTLVDLGAQKIACAIACLSAPRFGLDAGARNIKILGSACVRSSGFSAGRIVNIFAAETAIRRAVGQAEAQAGLTVDDVIVTGQFAGLYTQIFEAKPASGQPFHLSEDFSAISAAVEEQCRLGQRKLIHMFTSAPEGEGEADGTYRAGGEALFRNVDVITVSMPLKGVRQIAACFAKSLLTVRSFIAGPVASALSVTNALERAAGVLVIDLGAQSTGYAYFSRGVPLVAECIEAGGQQITGEIARCFHLRPFEAERLKLKFGGVSDGLQADIDLPAANGETGEPISKFSLNQIIRSNGSLIFNAINERLKSAGYSIPSGGVVLTGGGSVLQGVRELASHVLAADVRIGQPAYLNGPNAGQAQSSLVGACLYASRRQTQGETPFTPGILSQDSSYASRISQWLRASF